jgi:hypothetical protein
MLSRAKPLAGCGVLLLSLALAALACSMPDLGPKAPCTVTRSTTAANQLIERVRVAGEQSAAITVTANNDEASSLFEQVIAEGKRSAPESTLDITNPVVCFSSGKVQIFGNVRPSSDVAVDALITLGTSVHDGRVAIDVQSVQIGPVGLPDQVRQDIETQLNDTLNQYLQYVTLTDVKFEQGQMTVSGTIAR